MASIRTIRIKKAELKWNTGMIRSLYFNHDKIVDTYKNLIKPRLKGKINKHSEIRSVIWNIAWHMNHHCKQLYKCCFVQVYGSYASIYGRVALSYTTGEVHDRKDYFLDKHYERDRNPGFYKNRNGEWSI